MGGGASMGGDWEFNNLFAVFPDRFGQSIIGEQKKKRRNLKIMGQVSGN